MSKGTPPPNEKTPRCFVIMPFKQKLYYLFAYLQLYIETRLGIICERGDSHVSTKTIEKKVIDKIFEADVIIADCTGWNANVFFELGIAYTAKKEVILIMQDDRGDKPKPPTDISNRDVLYYNFHSHKDFTKNLHEILDDILHPNLTDLPYAIYKMLAIREAQHSNKPLSLLGEDEFDRLLEADPRAMQEILDPQNSIP